MTNLRRGVFFVWGLSLLLAAPVLYTKVKKNAIKIIFCLIIPSRMYFQKIVKIRFCSLVFIMILIFEKKPLKASKQ